ncbi:pentatricopeptide repeat-containing protein At2g29760, chloroplastic-like [Macadamia integrifolia]|uniref:pentatricopeptide repeat-containing protein At2g29760, chloroplastic-like n=1 Tax=Macadamia integrifolia TaxID=60698 RepID=UPI001C4F9725|nr:pentatricopeptide repeat-containing protein At2g29760, chloroplastic-like [Macadamia integrifolia]
MTELKQIHAHIYRIGLWEDHVASTKLLETIILLNSTNLHYCRLVFNQIQMPNTFTWNAMIKAHSITRNPSICISLYKEMLQRGSKPNGITLSFVSKTCADVGNVEVLMGLQGQVLVLGFCSDVFVLNSLIYGYSVCGYVDFARRVFDDLPQRDLISWTTVINSYVRGGRAKEAIELFFQIEKERLELDEVIVVAAFTASAQLRDLNLCRRIECLVRDLGVEFNSFMINASIDMYSKCGSITEARKHFDNMAQKNVISWNSMIFGYGRSGNMKEARRLFDLMPEKNEISWSTLLSGYAKNGALKEALMVFREMQAEGISPNDASITGAITVCAHLGALELGREIHSSLDDQKVRSDVVLGTALVDMYAKCGCLDISSKLFDMISRKNAVSYNVMMSGLAIHGKSSGCVEIFSKMVNAGIKPDSVTFVGILSGCAHAGWVEEGKKYFNLMTQVYGIAPRSEHVSCMVYLMGKTGNLEEALDFVRNSPVKADVSIWGALLSACKTHGIVELGELVAKEILELDPCHGGAYALLSNLYAAANKWEAVMKVRKKMKEIGVGSRPGWSLIELEGKGHEFYVGDNLHPKIKEIWSILGLMDFQMLNWTNSRV